MAVSSLPNSFSIPTSLTETDDSNLKHVSNSDVICNRNGEHQDNEELSTVEEPKTETCNDLIEDDKKASTSKTVSKSPEASERSLRKRKIDLNNLSSNLTCPKVCQFSNCGIQLPSTDALEWHYEGHFGHELEKLEKLKVRKPTETTNASSDNLILRRPLRNSAVDRIRFNREKRSARKTTNR